MFGYFIFCPFLYFNYDFNEAELNFITKEFQKENDDISKKKD